MSLFLSHALFWAAVVACAVAQVAIVRSVLVGGRAVSDARRPGARPSELAWALAPALALAAVLVLTWRALPS